MIDLGGYRKMADAQINLTDEEREALAEISRRTGKSQEKLVHEAVDQLIVHLQNRDRRELLRSGMGIWKDRTDLPPLKELRDEMDRVRFGESLE